MVALINKTGGFIMPVIKKFSDGSVLEYDSGRFDDWCVYLTRPNATRHAPLDINYFTRLQQLALVHSSNKIYNDFVNIYDNTNGQIDENVLNDIGTLSQEYNNDALEIEIITIVYMGMVAEENKKYTKLGKRIKRLGIHQILIENMNPRIASNFSRGMRWRDIAQECFNRGF